LIPNIVFVGLKFFFLGLLYLFLIFVVVAVYREARAESTGEMPGRVKKKKKRDLPQLVVVAGDRNLGTRYQLDEDMMIGRASSSAIVVDDTYASEQHARLFAGSGGFYVEDVGSTNGTYVNGRKISYPFELREGDRVKIGKTVLEFRG
jgi:pSer/pThr/pTyr-binding forkhead associated (FHA) protein